MKVCSLYGAGFYYIPGTDTCLKIGGYVRSEWLHNANGSFSPFSSAATSAAGGSTLFTLSNTNDLISRTRGVVTLDARSQTEYGTLRSYFKYGIQWTTGDGVTAGSGAVAYYERAFIQFAGFTFGAAQSFFDFFAYPIYSYQTSLIGSDTGGHSINLWAYTAQLGNGVTATLSFEDQLRRRKAVVDSGSAAAAMPAFNALTGPVNLANDNPSGQSFPDIIGALRVDQTWGSAQVAVAAHQISPGYYQTGGQSGTCTTNTTACGHPDRDWGWAALAGLELNLPTGPGDKFTIAATWASGALGYVFTGGVQSLSAYSTNGLNGTFIGSAAYIPLADAIYSNAIGSDREMQLVEGWSIYAGLKHNWSPNLFSTLYGGYAETDWDTGAANVYCTGTTNPTAAQLTAVTGCDPNGSYYQIGSLTQWSPVRNFTIGVDVMYSKMNTSGMNNLGGGAATAQQMNLATLGARQGGVYRNDDVDFWSGVLRVQRNFWP